MYNFLPSMIWKLQSCEVLNSHTRRIQFINLFISSTPNSATLSVTAAKVEVVTIHSATSREEHGTSGNIFVRVTKYVVFCTDS